MAVLRNIDVSKKIGVSPATVKNWIEYAQTQKIQLDLTKIGNKYYIEDTMENIDRMCKLKNQGVKYRSKQEWVRVDVLDKFTDTFSEDQVIEIIESMEYHHYIPLKFIHHSSGVNYLAQAINEEIKEENSTSEENRQLNRYLYEICQRYIDQGFKINIWEIGHDYSTRSVETVLKELDQEGHINKFFSVSISEDMHDVRRKTINDIFHLKTEFVPYTIDWESQSMKTILFKERQENNCINLMLYLNFSLTNFMYFDGALAKIESDMSQHDLAYITMFYQHKSGEDKGDRMIQISSTRVKRFEWLFKLLNIHKYVEYNLYSYDRIRHIKTRYLELKNNIELHFKLKSGLEKVIRFDRDQKIYYFLSRRFTDEVIMRQLNKYFEIEQANKVYNEQIGAYLLNNRKFFK